MKLLVLATFAYIFISAVLIVLTICLLVVGAEMVYGVYEFIRDEIERRK